MVTRPTTCTGISSFELKHHAWCECSSNKNFKLRVVGLTKLPCHHSRKGVVHLPVVVKDCQRWFYHGNCVHNIISALVGRVALCVPTPTPTRLAQLIMFSQALARSLGNVSPITFDQVIRMYRGFRRRRYESAKKTLNLVGPFVDSRVKMFVKMEGIKFTHDKVNPACRAIQFRSPEYQLQIATYIKPIEHILYRAVGPKPYPASQFIAKNLNGFQRAQLLRKKFDDMPGCEILMLDASRFDGHVTPYLNAIENNFYTTICPDSYFRKMLKARSVNKGSARGEGFSVSYSLKGGRMSGDMDTASSNCLLMSTMLALLGSTFCSDYDFLVDGDDSVFFYRGPSLLDSTIKEFFLECGMEMKIDNRTTDFWSLDFCQGKPVELPRGVSLVRDPLKVMSKVGINDKFFDPTLRCRILEVLSLGELSLVRGCPILQHFFDKLLSISRRALGKTKRKKLKMDWMSYRQRNEFRGEWWKREVLPITPRARETFSQAWGITIKEQLSLEKQIDEFDFDLKSTIIRGEGLDVSRWLFDAFSRESS